jgi:citronellol/citronellal dehydrogenase
MSNLAGKVAFITGGSRGIGEAIARKLAAEGVHVSIVAKSVKEDPRLGGTVHSVARSIIDAGGRALGIKCDIRDEDQVIAAVQETIAIFGGIDIVVNNASAISLTSTADTEAKRFDLVHDINVRGTFLVTKYCLPFLKKSTNPHILTLSPPIDLNPKWIAPFVPYTLSKYNMSMMTLGWAREFAAEGIAVNSLWPATTIATAAVKNMIGGDEMMQRSRKPSILADAAYSILKRESRTCTGNLFIDEDVLRQEGITDLGHYAVNPDKPLQKDLYVP